MQLRARPQNGRKDGTSSGPLTAIHVWQGGASARTPLENPVSQRHEAVVA